FLWFRKQGRLVQSMIMFLLGFILVMGMMIVADSLYYGSLTLSWQDGTPITSIQQFLSSSSSSFSSLFGLRWNGTLTLTFLNNLIYNVNIDNLALHGIHPRYTHFLLNFPLLYGPLAVMALWAIYSTLKKLHQVTPNYLFYVLTGIIVNALVGLSLMPHQEARFLVPLLVPLVMIYTWDQTSNIGSLPFMLLWFGFNLATSYILGNLHQAGIVPTLGFIQRQSMGINGCQLLDSGNLTCDLVPVGGGPAQVSIEDVASNKTMLYDTLKKRQGIKYRQHEKDHLQIEFAPSKEKPGSFERTLLICPNVTPLPDIPGQRYMLISTYSPHVNFDDMAQTFQVAKEYDSPINLASLMVFAILSDDDLN
ncbi:Alg9-like mannosyltransferase family-domain-containing protein, partial [Halteromyces radiatus]|uniref:Alg9-like mannosyltransferase family-domain-containing protein n=1 Tax=Halteromyces radiatus TaxID=101107 RepID=UPI00221EAF07